MRISSFSMFLLSLLREMEELGDPLSPGALNRRKWVTHLRASVSRTHLWTFHSFFQVGLKLTNKQKYKRFFDLNKMPAFYLLRGSLLHFLPYKGVSQSWLSLMRDCWPPPPPRGDGTVSTLLGLSICLAVFSLVIDPPSTTGKSGQGETKLEAEKFKNYTDICEDILILKVDFFPLSLYTVLMYNFWVWVVADLSFVRIVPST